jgi:hypothetical protein
MDPPDNAIILCVDEESQIKDFIKELNASVRSFKWTKKSDEILTKIHKAREGTIIQNVWTNNRYNYWGRCVNHCR